MAPENSLNLNLSETMSVSKGGGKLDDLMLAYADLSAPTRSTGRGGIKGPWLTYSFSTGGRSKHGNCLSICTILSPQDSVEKKEGQFKLCHIKRAV